MEQFDSGGVKIAYSIEGRGEPVLLIHGFASNGRVNWEATGWVQCLVDAGHQVIIIDNRGHGLSEKLYDPRQYEAPEMAEDSSRLLAHLGIERAAVMGYSMGARITAFLAINHPDQVSKAIMGGMAGKIFSGVSSSDAIADALEAEDQSQIADVNARAFRIFAERTKSDLKALAACMRAGRPALTHDMVARITCPALVVAGDRDDIAGKVEPLVDALPDGHGLTLSGKDHMTAVGDKTYKRQAVQFLAHGKLDVSLMRS